MKYLLFILFFLFAVAVNAQLKVSDLPVHFGKLDSLWFYTSNHNPTNTWNSNRVSFKQLRDSIHALDTGNAGPEHDPIWEAVSLPDIPTLMTFTPGANKQAIVRDTIRGGLFHKLSKTGRVIDSALVFPSSDPDSVFVRDRSQTSAINAKWFLTADYNTTTGVGTDNKPRFVKMLQAATRTRSGIVNIFVPVGDYYFSDSIAIRQACHIYGDGNGANTAFYFASGKNGFSYERSNTPAGFSGGSSDNSEIDHITFNQKSPIAAGHAIIIHASNIKVHDCFFNDFGGAAVYINAGQADNTSTWFHIRNVIVNDRGDPFTSTPTITASSPTGSGATFSAVMATGISLTQPITNGGHDYYTKPVVRVGNYGNLITEDNIETNGYSALATAVMGVDAVYVTNQGNGYTTMTITATGAATNATFTPVLSGGKLISVIVNSPGSGYDDWTDVHFVITGNGTGAAIFATLKVVSLNVTNQGGLYETAPVIRFFGGGRNTSNFQAASGTAALGTGNKKLKRVNVLTEGNNYHPGTTTLTVSGGGPTGVIPKLTAVTYSERLGNANRTECRKLFVDNCLCAIWTEGSDANAGHFEELKITNCRYWAIREGSFLGNGYSNSHTSQNLGAYMAISNTGLNTKFDNCYSEADQLASVGVDPAKLYGGDHGAGIEGSFSIPLSTYSNTTGTTGYRGTVELGLAGTSNTETIRLGGLIDNGEFLTVNNSATTEDTKARFFLIPSSGTLSFGYDGSSGTNRGFLVTGQWTTSTFGTSTIKPYSFFADRFYVGENVANARRLTNATAMPTSGEYAAGDLVLNRTPNNTTKIFAWLRITTGTSHVLGVDWMQITSSVVNRFGIEDNTSTINRDIDMQNHNFTIRNTKFGINTTNPQVDLQIGNPLYPTGTSITNVLQFAVSGAQFVSNNPANRGNGGYIVYSASNDAEGQMYGFFAGRTARGSVSSPATLNAGDTILKIGGAQWRPDGWPEYATSAMNIINDGIATSTSAPTYMGLSTTPIGSTTNVERLRLKATGQLRFNAYTSSSSFTGTAVAGLGFTSSGDVIPIPLGGGGSETDPVANAKNITLNAGAGVSITGTATQTIGSNPSYTISDNNLRATSSSGSFSLAGGAFQDFLVTITGAALNDPVVVGSAYMGADDVLITGSVSTSNQIAVRVKNNTGGTIIFSGLTFKIIVFK